MELKTADLTDIEETLKLHYRYHIDSISEEDRKEGFVTTPFTKEDLTQLVNREKGLFIARQEERVVAYVIAASWNFWSAWPMFEFMIKDLPNLNYKGYSLNTENSYQYGPICIHSDFRGTDLLKEIFTFAKINMAKRFPVLLTFVNKKNIRSYHAHKIKLELDVIQEFEFNDNQYYEMACLTN